LQTSCRPSLNAINLPKALLDRLRSGGAEPLVEQLLRSVDVTDAVDLNEWAEPDDWLLDGQEIRVGNRTLKVIATLATLGDT